MIHRLYTDFPPPRGQRPMFGSCPCKRATKRARFWQKELPRERLLKSSARTCPFGFCSSVLQVSTYICPFGFRFPLISQEGKPPFGDKAMVTKNTSSIAFGEPRSLGGRHRLGMRPGKCNMKWDEHAQLPKKLLKGSQAWGDCVCVCVSTPPPTLNPAKKCQVTTPALREALLIVRSKIPGGSGADWSVKLQPNALGPKRSWHPGSTSLSATKKIAPEHAQPSMRNRGCPKGVRNRA